MAEKLPTLTKASILDFLKSRTLMAVATCGDFPWIATVYYAFDPDIHLYFLSRPTTLHAQQIFQNSKVAVAIADSQQSISKPKRGLQLSGIAEQLSDIAQIKRALELWKSHLGVVDPALTHEAVKDRMFRITPKRIKLFDQELFKVADGQESILEF